MAQKASDGEDVADDTHLRSHLPVPDATHLIVLLTLPLLALEADVDPEHGHGGLDNFDSRCMMCLIVSV
jgi:hypothetical protein